MSTQYIFSIPKFHKFTSLIESKDHAIATFFESKTIKEVCNVKKKYYINKTMQDERALFSHVLKKAEKFKWEIPILHLIESN